MQTFIIHYRDGRQVRIKAGGFSPYGGSHYRFYKTDMSATDALLDSSEILSVIPQDMLLSSFEEGTVLPDITSGDSDSTDFAGDALFSAADKVPFTPPERQAVVEAIRDAEQRIADTFSPTKEQFNDLKQKLDFLSKKVSSLDKFNWKRLLITTLVGISVDLGFGTLIPSALLEIFKEVFAHLSERFLSSKRPSIR